MVDSNVEVSKAVVLDEAVIVGLSAEKILVVSVNVCMKLEVMKCDPSVILWLCWLF